MTEDLRGWRWGLKITHAGSDILPLGKDVTVTIEKIEAKEDELVGGTKMDTYVATFRPNPYTALPMVLRSTNLKVLRKISGVEDPALIKDFNVILTRELTNDPQMGGKCYGLRISKIKAIQNGIVTFAAPKPEQPIVKQPLTLTSEKYEGLKKWLSETGTLTGLLKAYEPDSECLVELKKIKEI